MRIAVLGASSFLARSIVAHWKHIGLTPTLFSRKTLTYPASSGLPQTRFSIGSVEPALEELADFDVILYAAGAGVQSGDPASSEELDLVNATYPIRVLDHLKATGWKGRWISFGSYFEIGDVTEPKALDESAFVEHQLSGHNPYCHSKKRLTQTIASFDQNVFCHHLVLPNAYGLGEDSGRLIPYLVNTLNKGQRPKLSAGLQRRQFLHISDLYTAVDLALNGRIPTGILNFTPVGAVAVRDVVAEVYQQMGIHDSPEFGAVQTRDQKMAHLELDPARAFSLGWRPRVSLDAGIATYLP